MFASQAWFGRRSPGKSLATVACLLVLISCSTVPRTEDYFGPDEAVVNPVSTAAGTQPRIAVAGILQLDSTDGVRHDRLYQTKDGHLATLLGSVVASLTQDPVIRAEALLPLPFGPSCPLSGDSPRDPAVESCLLPDRVDFTGPSRDPRLTDFSHLLLVVGEIAKVKDSPEVVWTFGYPVPAPFLAVSTQFYFYVTAGLYDLSTGKLLTEARASQSDSSGLLTAIVPPVPLVVFRTDEGEYMESLGKAVGAEMVRRFAAGRAGFSPPSPRERALQNRIEEPVVNCVSKGKRDWVGRSQCDP